MIVLVRAHLCVERRIACYRFLYHVHEIIHGRVLLPKGRSESRQSELVLNHDAPLLLLSCLLISL